ncbi:MAG: NADH-quinone oxidoreductase subunit L [Hyphomonadaceae bacterium]|nr:NADH-quinone oxidoreductase subunit L [Hyphomonadaceae bacterium]
MAFQDLAAIFIVLSPGIAAAIAGLGQRVLGDKGSMAITTGILVLAAALASVVFYNQVFGHHEGPAHGHTLTLMRWFDVGTFVADWAIRIDTLSVVMMFVVTAVAALVHIYSIGYMADDPHRARFFAYLSLFTFAMLMLVTADNFIQLFFGWEGVGLASYLLIGFWYKKPSANDAAIKAFVVNRVGDFGFALGVMALVFVMQVPAEFLGADGKPTVAYLEMLHVEKYSSIGFDTVFNAIVANAPVQPIGATSAVPIQQVTFDFLGQHVWGLEVIGVLLFIGAMGKSAQVFLHTCLPDAMEGPTPVSALIHAATMVTAGVFLVCRCSYLYEHTVVAANVVTVIGAVTCFFAATVGLAQNDIKRVVAYSTCSQLGYMFFAAGVGAYQAAMFHLFTHAFFKALLFLSAGAVIHGMHHEQDMRNMGGLRKKMPLTWAMMLIGTLALTGVGIPGIEQLHYGFAGFYSKDAIIESAYASHDTFAQFAFWLSIVAAFLTSFYSWRLMFMTFEGKTRADHHTYDHAHDPPVSMALPLVLLAVGAVAAGGVFYSAFVDHHQAEFWGSAIFNGPENHVLHDRHEVPFWVLVAPAMAWISGLVFAIIFYLLAPSVPRKMAAHGGPMHSFLSHKWYFDEIYHFVFVRGAALLGDLFWKVGDKKLIDGIGPDGVTGVAKASAGGLSKLHTGYLFHYALVILLSAVVFAAFVLLGQGR